jgi:two-component sensor histidine kinase
MLEYFGKEQNTSNTVAHNNMIGYLPNSSKSHLWIGYNGGFGFSQLEYRTNKFSHYKIETNEPHFSAINTVNCMLEEEGGNLWIGTNGGGLIYFDRKKNKFNIYTQSDGLKSNYINAILPDLSGRLWAATSNGVCMMNTATREITNLSINLGLESNGFLPNGLLKRNKNMLFFAGSKLVEVNPEKLRQHNYPSRILFSSFKVFDKETSLDEKPDKFLSSLSYRQNFFSIEYSLLTPDPNNNTQYTYRLKGFDENWINVKERRVAFYTNVPPGSYTFQVKAVDASGKIYLSRPIEISVIAPFWKTWWFFCLCGMAIVALLFGLYRYRLNHVLKIERIRTRIATDLHDDIGATLSSISMYSDSVKEQIKEKLPHLNPVLEKMGENSRSMVGSINDIVWAINPDNDEGKKMAERMESYGKDLCAVKNVRLQFFADEKIKVLRLTLEERKNIYLVFKEALNNALKYAECSAIQVDLRVSNKEIELIIKDNGKGIAIHHHKGNGLKNMKMRAAEINGKISIESVGESGTTITLQCRIT